MVKNTSYLSPTQWLQGSRAAKNALQGLARGLSFEDRKSGHTCATELMILLNYKDEGNDYQAWN